MNPRTLEICRAAGIDMDGLRTRATPRADGSQVVWMTDSQRRGARPSPLRAAGRRLPRRHADAAPESLPAPLRAGACSTGCAPSAVSRSTTGTSASASRRPTPTASRRRSRTSRAASATRSAAGSSSPPTAPGAAPDRALGIEMIGPDRLQSFVMIHFEANLRHAGADAAGDPLLDGRSRSAAARSSRTTSTARGCSCTPTIPRRSRSRRIDGGAPARRSSGAPSDAATSRSSSATRVRGR